MCKWRTETYHCHVLTRFNEGGIGEESVDNAAEHDRFCGERNEVFVPVCFELRAEGFDFCIGEAQFCAYIYVRQSGHI